MHKYFEHFQDALSYWREIGGWMQYLEHDARTPKRWGVTQDVYELDDTVRKCTTDALRNGGMTDEEIAKEMADFND